MLFSDSSGSEEYPPQVDIGSSSVGGKHCWCHWRRNHGAVLHNSAASSKNRALALGAVGGTRALLVSRATQRCNHIAIGDCGGGDEVRL